MQTSEPFLTLLSDFSQSAGLPDPSDAQGVEFEAGEFVVVVLQHPVRSDSLVAEVMLTQPDSASRKGEVVLRALHQINEAARFEHDWMITLSPDDAILIHAIRPIAQTTAADLESLLCDGIDRAEALKEILAGLVNAADGDSSPGEQSGQSEGASARVAGLPAGVLRA